MCRCTDQYFVHELQKPADYMLEVKTYLFDEADEASPEAPGLVPVTLQGADGDLLRLLHSHGHHVHGVIHQRRIRLQRKGGELGGKPSQHLRILVTFRRSRRSDVTSLVWQTRTSLGVHPTVNALHKWHGVSACRKNTRPLSGAI